MSSTSIFLTLLPHRRAAVLMDARIDALRGEGELSPADAVFLDGHLASCPRCRSSWADRQALVASLAALPTRAPEGFAGRVLLAAKARGKVAPEEASAPASWSSSWLGLAAQPAVGAGLVVLVVAALGAVVALHPLTRGPEIGKSHVETGGAGLVGRSEAPDFVVRAPGLGAAKVRAQVTAIAHAHRGSLEESGNAILARIPRSELVALTQDLAGQGRYKMSKASDRELSAEVDSFLIRFELE